MQVLAEATVPVTRLVELPGRGVTRVWECAGPPGAPTLMLIHGVACTAQLNWGKALAPLASSFHVVAADLRGHGDGIPIGSRFRLEDCADDIAALAGVLGVGRFTAVGYSMGGLVAQLLYRRHPSLASGLVLCSTTGNILGSLQEKITALAMTASMRWNPFLQLLTAEVLEPALLGPFDAPDTASWARAQLRRTSLSDALAAIEATCDFSSDGWIGQVDVPTAVVITTEDGVVPVSSQRELAAAIPGASVYEVNADHAACITKPKLFVPVLLHACRSVQREHAPTVPAPVPPGSGSPDPR